MFIAIIVAHYNEFRRDYQSDKNVSFIEVVHKIIKANMFKEVLTVESKQLADQQNSNSKCCSIQAFKNIFSWEEDSQKNDSGIDKTKNDDQENTQAVLGGRVLKPRFHDYKIQYGMKSYFNEEFSAQNNALIQNAAIYKRGEKEGFQEYDFNNANFWIYYLEENLIKQTNNKVSLYDFHGDDGIFSDLIENLDPESLTKQQQLFLMFDKNTQKTQRLNYFSGPNTTLLDKYDLWKAMDFEN